MYRMTGVMNLSRVGSRRGQGHYLALTILYLPYNRTHPVIYMTPGRSQNIASSLLVGLHRSIADGGLKNVHKERESLLNLCPRTVNPRRPERARNEGSTGPIRPDDTRCTTFKRRLDCLTRAISARKWKRRGYECAEGRGSRTSRDSGAARVASPLPPHLQTLTLYQATPKVVSS